MEVIEEGINVCGVDKDMISDGERWEERIRAADLTE